MCVRSSKPTKKVKWNNYKQVNQKKVEKNKKWDRKQTKIRTESKTVDFKATILITTLNVNGLNTSIKK